MVLPTIGIPTTRNKFVPIKVNKNVWQLVLDRLPTRANSDNKGIDIDSTLCPICSNHSEDVNHLFFGCDLTLEIWQRIRVWIDMNISYFSNVTYMFQWIDSHMVVQLKQKVLKSVFSTLLWVLWYYRNTIVFRHQKYRKVSCLIIS